MNFYYHIALSSTPANRWLFFLLIVLFSVSVTNHSFSQSKKPAASTAVLQKPASPLKEITRILFVLDASSSMMNPWEGKTKIDVARNIIAELEDSLEGRVNVQTALRVYGHQSINTDNDCNDSKLEVPFAAGNAEAVKERLNAIRPKGITPLALSLEKSAEDFPPDPLSRNIIVLITDGEESCGGDACAISLQMQKKHIFLKPFVIGLNVDQSATGALQCIGEYFNAQQPSGLREIMRSVIDRVLSSAYLRINLLDANGKPLETDADITFYDATSDIAKYNFYHTLNYRGVPDTLQIDPVPVYDLVIHTIPPIEKKGLSFSSRENDELNIPASQGFLRVELTSNTINNNLNSKIKCLVKKAGSQEIIMVQDMNTTIKYLSGKYDLEILTLPRMVIKNTEITQSSTTSVKIEVPGVLNISKKFPGYGGIFITEKNSLIKIYELNQNLTSELVGLQAGEYTVIFHQKSSKKTTESVVKTFRIKSGQSAELKL